MTAGFGASAARAAAAHLAPRLPPDRPVIALVLGSGLGSLAEEIEDPIEVPYREIPGFPPATVAGHRGSLIAGILQRRPVLALAGRFHIYEGHDARLAGFPVRLVHALGARTLFVSNAAGGIRATFRPGDLMVISDHVNLMFRNPLIGAVEPSDERFPDMAAPYDSDLRALTLRAASSEGIALREGVYAGLLGPAYETPAEVRMLGLMGADAVGMSTVPEVLVARALGMRVAGMSCITNLASGLSAHPITHAEVLETTTLAAERFNVIVRRVVAGL
jgi:purine-nucleoside phosphorylase